MHERFQHVHSTTVYEYAMVNFLSSSPNAKAAQHRLCSSFPHVSQPLEGKGDYTYSFEPTKMPRFGDPLACEVVSGTHVMR